MWLEKGCFSSSVSSSNSLEGKTYDTLQDMRLLAALEVWTSTLAK